MNYEYVKIPKITARRTEYSDGANVPSYVDVHECICKSGSIEHHRTPGFDDDFFTIKCKDCNTKYRYIEVSGSEWKLYFAK